MVRTALSVTIFAGLLAFGGCASRQSVKIDGSGRPVRTDHIVYSGGSGDSQENATKVVGAQSQREVFMAEEDFISQSRGKKGKDWKMVGHSSLRENKRVYDVVEIELLPSMTKDYFYFDITGSAWNP